MTERDEDYESPILDAIDDYIMFREQANKWEPGIYCGYVYSHLERDEAFYKIRKRCAEDIEAAVRRLVGIKELP